MIKLALFDVDGTLIRTGGAGVAAFEKTAAVEFNVPDGMRHIKFAGRTDRSLVREFFNAYEIEPSEANFGRFFRRYLELLPGLLPRFKGSVCPGVSRFLAGLRALPCPPSLGLLTGNIREGAKVKLIHFGLWDQFETGGFGDDHEDRNQIAAIARDRANRLRGAQLDGGEILVVGDTHHDVRCGRAIGAKVLGVATGGASLAQLKDFDPDWAVNDLTEVSAASFWR